MSPTPLAPGLRVVLAPNPGLMTGPGTNQYLLGDGDDAVQLDCAPLDAENVRRFDASGARPRTLVLTHIHPDHVGGALAWRARSRGTIAIHESRAGFPVAGEPLAAERRLVDGDEIVVPGGRLRVVHTPGHESGHCCLFDPERRWLFTGDTVLSTGTTVIAPPDGDMQAYFASLERLRALDAATIFPGHGPPIDDPAAILDEYVRHRRAREAQIVDAVGDGVETIPAMVERCYPDLHPGLRWAAGLTVQAHLTKLEREGRAAASADGRWRLV